MGSSNSTLSSGPWRHGLTHWATFELYPEWTGKTFYAFKGMAYHRINYTTGTLIILKTFRHREGSVIDWIPYKERCDVARKMATSFNEILTRKTCSAKINVMKPIEVFMDSTSFVMTFMRILMRFDKKFADDEVVLFEEFLHGDFQTFVSTNGQATGSGSDILDAFSHFTYHEMKGKLVVCNLKGVEAKEEYKLSNPTIHSCDGRYGNKDRGDEGINDFFINHTCNAFCINFIKPTTKDGRDGFEHRYFQDSVFTGENVTDEKLALIDGLGCELGPLHPPQYSLSDTFGPPSYTTRDNNT